MKKVLILNIFLFIALNAYTQQILSGNLVPNHGFEDYTTCPDDISQIKRAIPWDPARGNMDSGSSEFIHLCSINNFIQNVLAYNNPKNDFGCAGIVLFSKPSMTVNNYREYIEVKLKDSLKNKKKYCCNLFTVNTKYPSNIGIENIGILITKMYVNSFNQLGYGIMIIDSIPQIKNRNGIITDTVNWTKISGVYEAKGNEQYITIGNFNDDNHTNWIPLKPIYGIAYYLIDDVSVCECSFDINLGADTALCESETLILNPNLPNATYTWQDSSHATTYEVKQPGTYWVRAYVAEYDITSTDTIVITAATDSYCNPPLTIPNVITPNGDSQNDNFVIQNAETYEIALQIYNRWGNLIYETTNYQNDFSCNNCADGVYFYLLKAKSKRNGREKDYKGSLTVLK